MKAKIYALDYLQYLKASHSKMNNLVYTELKLQDYLKSEIPVNEAKHLYQFRVRVANFRDNFKGRYQSLACPFCCVHLDTQVHSVQQCEQVKKMVNIDGNYSDIFWGKIQNNISRTLFNISKLREDLIL